MKQEIERKFEVKNMPDDLIIEDILDIEQAFIYKDLNTIIRIRKIRKRYADNEINYIYTLKTKGDIQYDNNYNVAKKYEIENEIQQEEYEELIKRKISNIINKTRVIIPVEKKKVELDIYYDYFEGLLTAEVEFSNEEEAKNFNKPDWLGEELGYKELSNRKLAEMTKEEWKEKVSKETIKNNEIIIQELKKKYNI